MAAPLDSGVLAVLGGFIMAGKGDKDRTRDYESYRNAPIWDTLGLNEEQISDVFNVAIDLASIPCDNRLAQAIQLDFEPWKFGFEKLWANSAEHINTRLRLYRHAHGYWVLVASCGGGYGADEAHWRECNIGSIKVLEDIGPLYSSLDELSKVDVTPKQK